MKKYILGALVAAFAITLPVAAQYVGGGSVGAGGSSFSSIITTALNFSGLDPDIITPSGEDLTIAPGSGGTRGDTFFDGDEVVISTSAASANGLTVNGLPNTDSTWPSAYQACGSGHSCMRIKPTSSRTGGFIFDASVPGTAGGSLWWDKADATNDKEVWAIKQENTSLTLGNYDEDNGALNQLYLTFKDSLGTAKGGLWGSTAQTCDCGTAGTPNTVTCNISSNFVALIDGDADDCTVTISDTFATAAGVDSEVITIVVRSTGGGGAFNIAEVAGVLRLEASAAWAGDAVGDNLSLMYLSSGSTDEFIETARATNL